MRICLLLLATLVTITSTFGKEKENLPKIEEKLKIIIPKFEQSAAKITEILNELKQESIRQDPEKKGITIIHRLEEEIPFAEADPFAEANTGRARDAGSSVRISSDNTYNFNFENMPVGEIIRYICINAGLKYKVDKQAVIITSKNIKNERVLKTLIAERPSIETQISMIRDQVDALNQDLQLLEKLVKEKGEKQELANITEKLKLVIPKVRFVGRHPDFVFDFLKRITRDLDPKKEGLNLIVRADFKPKQIQTIRGVSKQLPEVNLDADNIPVGEVIRYVCESLGLKYKVEKFAVVISSH